MAYERAGAHVERHSVWLHNSLRGAAGLSISVLVADLSGVQHWFWIVLVDAVGVALECRVDRAECRAGLLGTVIGFIIGGILGWLIGTNDVVLWLLLPIAILFAGLAPTAISFAVGKAGFTATVLIMFNIISPAGWRIGLVRVEDIAIGCAVSLLVGALFWPRGAGAALGQALAEAYAESADYLRSAVAFGSPGRPGGSGLAPAGRRVPRVSGRAGYRAPAAGHRDQPDHRGGGSAAHRRRRGRALRA